VAKILLLVSPMASLHHGWLPLWMADRRPEFRSEDVEKRPISQSTPMIFDIRGAADSEPLRLRDRLIRKLNSALLE